LKDKIKAIDKQQMGTQRGNRGAMVRVVWWGIPMWENQPNECHREK
jgi:hypothetical protein